MIPLRLLRAALIVFAPLALGACASLTLALANFPAVFGDYQVARDIVYGENQRLRLDVYVPTVKPRTPPPVVVFFYGGGWTTGGKSQYRFVAEALLSRGCIVVVPDYRLFPVTHFPGFVEDAAQAVAWTHAHARDYGADPSKLFVMGHSAGAHIAAMVSFDERFLAASGGERSWIQGFIGLAGPYDFLPLTDPELQEIFAPAASYPASQPINFVDGNEPPALLLHGLADTTVRPRNSQHLAAKIREQGGKVAERYYDDMSHSGILGAVSVYLRSRRTVLDDIADFVDAAS